MILLENCTIANFNVQKSIKRRIYFTITIKLDKRYVFMKSHMLYIAQLSSRSNVTSTSKNTQRHRPANGQQQVGNKRTSVATKSPITSNQRSLVTPEPRQTATFSTSATGNASSSVSGVLGRQTSASSTGSGDGRPERVSIGGSNNKNKSTKNK